MEEKMKRKRSSLERPEDETGICPGGGAHTKNSDLHEGTETRNQVRARQMSKKRDRGFQRS